MAPLSPLRRRMIDDMMVRNLSPATQQSYIYAVAKFSRHFNRSPERLGLEDVRAYQLPPGKKFSMQEMLDRYKKVLPDKTKSFAHPSAADKHNAKDVMEFYAEGYSVFHGNTQTSQG